MPKNDRPDTPDAKAQAAKIAAAAEAAELRQPTHDAMIAALLREREGYARSGLEDRLASVDQQLALRGYKALEVPEGRSAKPLETAARVDDGQLGRADSGDVTRSEPPRGRRTRARETTDE